MRVIRAYPAGWGGQGWGTKEHIVFRIVRAYSAGWGGRVWVQRNILYSGLYGRIELDGGSILCVGVQKRIVKIYKKK